MFDHVKFGVSDFAASKAFYLKALESIGVEVVQEGPWGVEMSPPAWTMGRQVRWRARTEAAFWQAAATLPRSSCCLTSNTA